MSRAHEFWTSALASITDRSDSDSDSNSDSDSDSDNESGNETNNDDDECEFYCKRRKTMQDKRVILDRPNSQTQFELPESERWRYLALSALLSSSSSILDDNSLKISINRILKRCPPLVERYITSRVYAEYDSFINEYTLVKLVKCLNITVDKDWLRHTDHDAALSVLEETFRDKPDPVLNKMFVREWLEFYALHCMPVFPLPWDVKNTSFTFIIKMIKMLEKEDRKIIFNAILFHVFEKKMVPMMAMLMLPFLRRFKPTEPIYLNQIRTYSALVHAIIEFIDHNGANCACPFIQERNDIISWYREFMKSFPIQREIYFTLSERWDKKILHRWKNTEYFLYIFGLKNSTKDFLKVWMSSRITRRLWSAKIAKLILQEGIKHYRYGHRFFQFVNIMRRAIERTATLEDICYLTILNKTLEPLFFESDKSKVELNSIPLVIRLISGMSAMMGSCDEESNVGIVISEWLFRSREISEHGCIRAKPVQLFPFISIRELSRDIAMFPQVLSTLLEYETHAGMIAILMPIYISSKNNYTFTIGDHIDMTFHALYDQVDLVLQQLCPELSSERMHLKTLCVMSLFKNKSSAINGQTMLSKFVSSLKNNVNMIKSASFVLSDPNVLKYVRNVICEPEIMIAPYENRLMIFNKIPLKYLFSLQPNA
jgi:hypothetical protein